MNNQISRLIIDTCGRIVYLTVIFFWFTFWLYSYNSIDHPLKESWSLSITFFSAIGTISAVLVAIYTFYYKALTNKPNLEIQITSINSQNDDFLKKCVHEIYITVNNLGGKALRFITKLECKGLSKKLSYGIKPPYGYDVIKNLEDCNNGYRIIITLHDNLDSNLHELIKELNLTVSFEFIDTVQSPYSRKFKITPKNNNFLFLDEY